MRYHSTYFLFTRTDLGSRRVRKRHPHQQVTRTINVNVQKDFLAGRFFVRKGRLLAFSRVRELADQKPH